MVWFQRDYKDVLGMADNIVGRITRVSNWIGWNKRQGEAERKRGKFPSQDHWLSNGWRFAHNGNFNYPTGLVFDAVKYLPRNGWLELIWSRAKTVTDLFLRSVAVPCQQIGKIGDAAFRSPLTDFTQSTNSQERKDKLNVFKCFQTLKQKKEEFSKSFMNFK